MIRHGKPASGWGDHGADPDPGLDATGLAQAEASCATLLALPERPTAIFTSPLRRCRETAALLAHALGIEAIVEPLVAEIPTPKALQAAERAPWLRAAFETTWPKVLGDLDYVEWRDAVAQAVAAKGGAAIFSHFVAINAAVSAATGDERVLSVRPDTGSITVFETDGQRLTLIERGREAETRVL
jgi:broad specificity phosphatase PhoE